MENSLKNARYLASALKKVHNLQLVNDNIQLPILALRVKDKKEFTVFQMSDKLRERGWIVPAYSLPPNAEQVEVLRIVIKENFSRDMAGMLIEDMHRFSKELKEQCRTVPEKKETKQQHKHIC
jgi:glutamate decarboxylase